MGLKIGSLVVLLYLRNNPGQYTLEELSDRIGLPRSLVISTTRNWGSYFDVTKTPEPMSDSGVGRPPHLYSLKKEYLNHPAFQELSDQVENLAIGRDVDFSICEKFGPWGIIS